MPSMRYVHVMRNGLDMAYSGNQHQLRFWGAATLGVPDVPVDPRHSLKYWCAVHRRVLDVGEAMHDRFLLVDFDVLVDDPARGLDRLCEFVGISPDRATRDELLELIRRPPTSGRHRRHDIAELDQADVAYASSIAQ